MVVEFLWHLLAPRAAQTEQVCMNPLGAKRSREGPGPGIHVLEGWDWGVYPPENALAAIALLPWVSHPGCEMPAVAAFL